jgi:kumamolisin
MRQEQNSMSSQVILRGSERRHPANAIAAGQPDPNEEVQITLCLRRQSVAPAEGTFQPRLTRAELEEQHGADPADIDAVAAFASEHHLSVAAIHPGARTVILRGKLSTMAWAFAAELRVSKVGERVLRTRENHLQIPEHLEGVVVAVLGFDERPVAQTNHKVHTRASQPAHYTPRQLAKIYNFPSATGKDQAIAVIELGGGYRNSDLQKYWTGLGLKNVFVGAVSVDGAQNAPSGDPNGADGEVVLDIEVAGGIAPEARIAVYFAPNTDQGFLNAINAAIHDTVRKPSVISISWGSAESQWTAQALDAFNAAFQDAALLGITVCAAAGDDGSSDGVSDGGNHVDFPASSPWVLSCGGTRLLAAGGTIQNETVWNDGTNGGATGGGVSAHFSQPAYQSHLHIPKPRGTANTSGRGVPDVAGVADPETGYAVLIDGQETVIGGTSAVAPLWAGLVALCNEQLGHNLGWFHPTLYGTLARDRTMNDITSGTNGAYNAGIGWDCCTGLGTPNGKAILNALRKK